MTVHSTPLHSGAGATGAAAAAVIETTGLTKRYPGPVTALDGLTVAVEPGVTGLVGSNGAGKSTLIKILLGLLPPTAAKERAAETLRHVGLYEERYRQIGTYSTGMKQRVKLAQALVGDPRLLLLDEPTNGLDPAGRATMLELIARIGGEFGIAVVVASHLLGEVEQICDHLVAIDSGRLLRAASMSSFTQASQVLAIEVEEGTDQLAAELARRGLQPVAQQRELLIRLTGEETYDAVRDVIADLGLPLNRMEQRRHRVEELFRGDPAAAADTMGEVNVG